MTLEINTGILVWYRQWDGADYRQGDIQIARQTLREERHGCDRCGMEDADLTIIVLRDDDHAPEALVLACPDCEGRMREGWDPYE